MERNSRSVVDIPRQFLGLKPLGGCPNKSAIRPFNSHVWKVSKWLFLAASRLTQCNMTAHGRRP
ncbi:MAG: hypothetical protein KAR22_04115, partial [Gammaproteobacteria bacterium]|nr:hypothetical protein [Gammaproteobacteria bacterium]